MRPTHGSITRKGDASLSKDAHSLYPLYVIVLNWNLPEDTIACVESVQTSKPPEVEIIIVDNGSIDDSVKSFREHFGSRVQIIQNSQNLGFAAGVNIGIQRAMAEGARSVLLLNNDTVVAPDMIGHLTAAAADLPQAGVLGPIIYYHDQPQRIWRFGDKEYRWLPVPLRLPDKALLRAHQKPVRVDYVTACGMLIKREVLEAIGLFDTCFFMYFEDADFCRRARQAGYEIWCVPHAKMWHKVSLSARKDKPTSRYVQSWGRAQFYRRHPHGLFPGLTLAYLIAKGVQTTLWDALSGDWELIRPLWTGTLDGYRDRPVRVSKP